MSNNYVNHEEFYNEIVKSQKRERLTEDAVKTLKSIATLILLKLPPIEDRDDVVINMLVEAQYRLKYFNPEHPAKPNSAFNFFNTMLKNYLKGRANRLRHKNLQKDSTI